MSNREGRTAKNSKLNFRKGQLCPRCQKGKLERPNCRCPSCKSSNNLICKTCDLTNF